MKLYLLEAFAPDFSFDEDSIVIALTPLVCHQLDKAGNKYSIIEDNYDQMELAATEDDYHQRQLQWIQGLDAFLQESIKELQEPGLKLASIYYSYIKTAILDPVYLRCYTLRKLFDAVKPAAVTFVSRPPRELPPNFNLFNDGRSYCSQVAEALCRQNGIPMESVFLESAADKDTATVYRDGSLASRLERVITRNTLIRKVYFFPRRLRLYCSGLKAYLFAGQKSRKSLNILLLKLTHIGEAFVIEALRKGHRIYRLSGNAIVRHSCFGARKYRVIKARSVEGKVHPDNDWEKAAGMLESHELIKQFSAVCRADVSKIVLPQLKYFIYVICPEIYGYIKEFTDFYEKGKIDFVITPHEVFPAEFTAIATAGHSQHTQSVELEHGDSAFAANLWDMVMLSRFNIIISANDELIKYFNHRCQVNRFSARIYRSPHRWMPVIRAASLRKTGRSIRKNRIIYLPTMFVGEHSRFDCANYPDTWYYQFQKALVEYFATRKEYTFVWKGLPDSDVVYNPIPDFIRDSHYTNIEVAINPFTRHLLSADRVICDYPSTGFYESVIAGIPTISLYHRALKVRKSATELFGKMLVPFSDTPEAVARIEEFLENDPDSYKATLETEGQGILDILEEVSREAKKQS